MNLSGSDEAQSWYAATAIDARSWPALDTDVDCDVCVIGAGFTGLTTALLLAQAGLNVVVLESRTTGFGASGRNGGQLGTGFNKPQAWLEKRLGEETARGLWQLVEDGKNAVKERIAQFGVDCELVHGALYTCFKASHVDDYRADAKHLRERYDYSELRFVEREELGEMLGTEAYFGAMLDLGAAHIHPLNYVRSLAQACANAGVRIFENTQAGARNKDGATHIVSCPGGRVRATTLVLAANGYLDSLDAALAPFIMPINSFIIATEPLGEARARSLIRDNVCVADSRFVVNYYRFSSDWRLLFGGRENYTRNMPRGFERDVRRSMLDIYPQLEDVAVDYAWGGRLAITMSRLPSVGELEPGVYFGQGFSGHGVAMTSTAAHAIADAITDKPNALELLSKLPAPAFPGGKLLRAPTQMLGMAYYAMLDRI